MSASSEKSMKFGWIEDGRLAGCRGPRSDQELDFLASIGIRALVRLAYEAETDIAGHDVEANGIEDCYEPVKDWTAPRQEQIDRVIRFIRGAFDQAKPVAVSCGWGKGRTGTILACHFVSLGQTADQAIDQLISIRPISKEILSVPGQKEAIIEFARRLQSGETSI